jgi:lipoprotein-releasing system permease protein
MSLFFAWRYLRSKKSTNAINIIAWISMVAIGVVTAALVVVLSVFNGFEDLVKQMYGDFYADLQVTSKTGKFITFSANQSSSLLQLEGIASVQPVIEERAILLDQEDKSIVWLKGVDETYANYSGIPGHMIRGSFFVGDSANPRVVLGVGVEQGLKIVAGQSPFPITVYLPNPEAGPSTDPAYAMLSANAYPSGSFAVQQEFDEQYAFTQIDFLKYMLDYPDSIFSKVEIFLAPGASLSKLKKQVVQLAGPDREVRDKFEQNQSLFAAMKTEKLIIYAIAFLILVIAGFNIISSLTMTVLEKGKDIAVLKAMGATEGMVQRVFQLLGMLLASIGAVAGFIIGLLICWGQQQFQWVKLAGQSFIISHYPVAVRLSDLLVVIGLVFCIALIAAWLPARRATKTNFSLR